MPLVPSRRGFVTSSPDPAPTEAVPSAPAAVALAPLALGDAFDIAFSLYRANFRLFLSVVAVALAPTQCLLMVAGHLVGADALMGSSRTSGGAEDQMPDMVAMLGLGAFAIVSAVLYGIAAVAQQGALAVCVAERYMGRDCALSSCYARTFPRLGRLLGTAFVVGMLATAGLFALVLMVVLAAGIVASSGAAGEIAAAFIAVVGAVVGLLGFLALLVVLGGFGPQIVMVEDQGWFAAIQRNVALVQAGIVRLVVGAAALWILAGVFQLILAESLGLFLSEIAYPALRIGWLAGTVAQNVCAALIGLVVQPYTTTVLTVLYYDSRVRREGLDIALAAARLSRRRTEARA